MLGRFYLATDRSHYSMENLPLAVLTLMVNGKNTGSNDPTEVEIPIAIWDGLNEEDKICLIGRKKRSEIVASDYNLIKTFDFHKLNRVEKAFSKMLEGSGRSKFLFCFKKIKIKTLNFRNPISTSSFGQY